MATIKVPGFPKGADVMLSLGYGVGNFAVLYHDSAHGRVTNIETAEEALSWAKLNGGGTAYQIKAVRVSRRKP